MSCELLRRARRVLPSSLVLPMAALLVTQGCGAGTVDGHPGKDGGSAPGRDGGRDAGGTDAGGARLDGGSKPDSGVVVDEGDASVPTPSGPVSLVDASHVRLLTGSPFSERQELHRRGYLASLDPDRLLFEYRKLAGLPQAGGATSGYPGWDTGFIRGHMAGHYLSAASRMAAATGDDVFKKRVEYVVAELAKCQTALGKDGYLAAFPLGAFDVLEGKQGDSQGIVVPYYTLQKILSGLVDAHHYVGSQQALDVAKKLGDFVRARLAALPASTIERIFRTDGSKNPQNEFGAMSDALSALSVSTGDAKYLETAKLFNRSWFIDPLAAGQDNLQGLHGNTHIAQAVGIAHTANLSGDSPSLKASEFFWKLLTGRHAFVIGGNSFHEWLDKGGVEAGSSIDNGASLPASTAETCNSNNMLKLTTLLFTRSQRIEYADYYERTLYNHIVASVAPDTGDMTYFTPLRGHFRTYMSGTFCCTGTGIENTARYGEGIYFQQENQVWVNLYIPSELTWDATGMTLRLEGNAAAGEPVRLTVVKAVSPVLATVNLRIPFWVSGPATLTVNGAADSRTLSPSTYASLSRQWRSGDVVTLQLPTSLRLERSKDVPSMVSVLYGPILLAGELGSDRMPNDVGDPGGSLGTAPATVPAIVSTSTDPTTWLRPVADAPLTFTAHDVGPASGLTFRPLYQVHHQRYSVYWSLQ